jgi:O-antigen ligase
MLSLNLLYTLFYLNKYNNVSGIFSVYYISSGHFGASLVILSLYLLFFRTKLDTVITKQVLVLAVLLGLFAVYISAARSPVLALIIVNLYFLILKKKIKFLVYFFLFLLLSVFFLYISRQILHLDSAFIERNYLWIFEGNTSGREPYLIRAVSIFRDNIIIGGRVLYEDGLHPHNIFLELLMVGGLVLLLLFGLLFYPLLRNLGYFFKTSTANFYILPLFAIWVQYFILTLTSNNIHSNPEFWYFGSVIIGISIKNHNEKT